MGNDFGTTPTRSGHTGITYNDTMVLFGGANIGYLNDVYMLKFKSNLQWIQVLPSGTGPSVRYMHSAIYHNMSMVVFGGTDDMYRYDDTFKLNFNTNQWLEATTFGTRPGKRHSPTAIYYKETMVVFGGYGYDGAVEYYLNDLFSVKS